MMWCYQCVVVKPGSSLLDTVKLLSLRFGYCRRLKQWDCNTVTDAIKAEKLKDAGGLRVLLGAAVWQGDAQTSCAAHLPLPLPQSASCTSAPLHGMCTTSEKYTRYTVVS